MPQPLPVDPDVKIPAAVKAQAVQVDRLHQAAYAPPAPDPQPAPEPQPAPAPAPQPAPEPAPPPAPAPAPEPAPQPAPAAPEGAVAEWQNRYNAMKGRFDQSQSIIAGMQDQMAQMGEEVLRLTSMVEQRQPPQTPPKPAAPLLTPEDREKYGDELLDVVRRAALEAVQPELQTLDQQNRQVVQRVTQSQRNATLASLDAELPEWRTINVSQRFRQWCALPDIYSGQVRAVLLRNAIQAAQAPRALAIFKGFLAEEQATGHLPAPQPAPQPPAPGHAPAVPLETLVAPGRAHPAPGQSGSPAEKPVFTRAMISQFYRDKMTGKWAGRDDAMNAYEQAIFLAQREGRVRS